MHTGTSGFVFDGRANFSYNHISWDIDGEVRAASGDCEPCHPGNTENDCDTMRCLYGQNTSYVHRACLTPGTHSLQLHDSSGFGWLGADISIWQAGTQLIKKTMPSNTACNKVTDKRCDRHGVDPDSSLCVGGAVTCLGLMLLAPAWDATCTTFKTNRVFQESDQCLGCCVSDLAMLRDAMPSGNAIRRVHR